jgi:hypothetical protein
MGIVRHARLRFLFNTNDLLKFDSVASLCPMSSFLTLFFCYPKRAILASLVKISPKALVFCQISERLLVCVLEDGVAEVSSVTMLRIYRLCLSNIRILYMYS